MEQGTPEWLQWRKSGIGASDVCVLFGEHPKLTRRELWLIKTGQKPEEQIPAFVRERGAETEKYIRADYSLFTGKNFEPRLATHDKYPFILASLDGVDEKSGEIIEIKYVGKVVFDRGEIPYKHLLQTQQQMMAVGSDKISYLMSMDGREYKKLVVETDKQLQADILNRCINFWYHVKERLDPGMEPKDEKREKRKEKKEAEADGDS